MPSSQTPTPEELAAIAAKLDPRLSPDEAIARAQALWEAADRALRATQIADDEEEKRTRAEGERLERIGLDLWDETIPLSEAFKVQQDFAKRVRISPYESEKRFVTAMRKAGLTIHRDIDDERLKKWLASKEPGEPVRETQELTSVGAVKRLFDQKVEQRRNRDRTRKAAGKTEVVPKAAKRNLQKIPRNFQAQKAEKKAKKRNASAKQRNQGSKKRKGFSTA